MEAKQRNIGSTAGESPGNPISLTDEERQVCEIWTRVMGYHRPVSSFNKGKKGEFYERKYFCEDKARLS